MLNVYVNASEDGGFIGYSDFFKNLKFVMLQSAKNFLSLLYLTNFELRK